ncbi:MAG TPA: hypothetical protein VIJ94_02375 [Caulobacteraceae bacterium]
MKLLVAAPLALALLAPTAASLDPSAIGVGQICSAERIYVANKGPRKIDFMPGIGTGGFAVRTTSAEAQKWFDYGLQLYHAFYHADAKLAFDKAVAADPDCALCRWGQALSRGPTQNFDIEKADQKAAQGLAQKALEVSRTDQEKRLSQAMIDRYKADQSARTEEKFAAALLKAVAADPAKTDVRLIAAEALLTADRRGDHAVAPQAKTIIEPILKAQPDNTAAIHYYIHATEASGDPADALPYAERLAGLAPGASHLIHMAAHTYIHVGRYEEVATLNARALEVDAAHAKATDAPGVLGSPDYYPHNLSFGLAGAMMAGDGPLAVKFADDAKAAFPPGGRPNMDYIFARVMSAYGRYAPDRALQMTAPKATDWMGVAMWRYARGEALAGKGDARAVREESRLIGLVLPKAANTKDFMGLAVANIAQRVLQGRAEMLEGHPADAAKTFAAVANDQDKDKWGMDPPPWWYPVRRSLAAAYLKAGRDADALREAAASLKAWPGDGLALHVRALAERRMGQAAKSEADEVAARAAWRGDLGRIPIDLI